EELKLENLYAQRGLELITPAVGSRILDRLLHQKAANFVAISADWTKARRAGLSGSLPPMFSELGAADTASASADAEASLIDLLSGCPEADRLEVVGSRVRQIVAAVFELAVSDIGGDDGLDDLGLDSLMAMDFKVRLNGVFGVDVPLLELLRGVSVNSLAARILDELPLTDAESGPVAERQPEPVDADVEALIERLSEAELRDLLAELEK